jgi:flavin reductase (DIM6/NTAB) family NADH-FMN oxidoreductase RutF
LECRVTEIIELKIHKIFFAEVVCTHIDKKFLNDDNEPLLSQMNVLCYANEQYWTMGEKLEDLYYSKYL